MSAPQAPLANAGDPFTNNPISAQNEKAQSTSSSDDNTNNNTAGLTKKEKAHLHTDGEEKIEMNELDCYDELGFGFPTWKKWMILTVVFWVQVSMNFNTALYSNALHGISEEFGVSVQAARAGAAVFLITYGFGCELWAPWSEEFGRKPILQLSLFLVNCMQLPVALAKNFASIMVGRAFGGICTAGGSVTLAVVADLWPADEQQYAVAFVVFSSVGGSILGPVVGGFSEQLLHWRWSIWIQLILGGVVQLIHLVLVPETRTTIMMDNIAKKRRKTGKQANIYGPNEMVSFRERFNMKEFLSVLVRPFRMFVTEPIVLSLSLLSGFSDALIFMMIQSFALVYKNWDFNAIEIGLAFLPILIGYFLAWFIFIPAIKRNKRQRAADPHDEYAQYESRLWFLLYAAPCLPIGLIGFAWTCSGPPLHWIGSMVFTAIIGIANYAIYMGTIDYMIAAYGPYAASATGGNGWARDFLAGVLTVPATPFFTNIGSKPLQYASTILFCISVLLVSAVYVIYFNGAKLRRNSPFACALAEGSKEEGGRKMSVLPTKYGSTSEARRKSLARGRSSLAPGGAAMPDGKQQDQLRRLAEANEKERSKDV